MSALLLSSCALYAILFFFFFSSRRRHTRSLCDWSSDVCSSDLRALKTLYAGHTFEAAAEESGVDIAVLREIAQIVASADTRLATHTWRAASAEIGRASCRERV